MIRLVGIDVDGTLVGSSGEVSAIVWQAAQRARDAGIHLALCSGRPACGVALEYARQLDPQGWHIFQNGASVLNLASGETRSIALSETSVQTLVTRARRTGELLELYSDRDFVIESTGQWARDHADLLGVPFEPRPFESLRGKIVRAQWMVELSQADAFRHSPDPELEVAVSSSPLMPRTAFVGMTRAGVSKGSAIRSVAQAMGIDVADIMYVGDADNDLPALRTVGHPVAMGNASASVLGLASRVVAEVDADGLAQALDIAIASGD